MPTEALPFNAGEASGLDELASAPPLMVNTLLDMANVRRSRPGVTAWSGFPSTIPNASPVLAMCVFNGDLVYVTQDRKFWQIHEGHSMALSDATSATWLAGSSRPVLLSTGTRVIAVGGGAPQKWIGTGTLTARLGGSPPNMSFIVELATRLVGSRNDASGIFVWSGLGEPVGHEVWDALNFQEAEASPDPLVAVSTNTNELFAWGTSTLQVYSPDPSVGFAPGRAVNLGLLAPYSLVNVDDMFALFDRERRFVMTDGRSFTDDSVISKPIEAPLRLLDADACFGFRMRLDRWDVPVWMFPNDGLGYMWDRRNGLWSEWRAFGSTGYGAPIITSAFSWPEENLFLVGLSTGQIAKLDADAHTDLGQIIKVEMVTGFVDHGTDSYKLSQVASFVFRRGSAAQDATAPQVYVSWRDDTGGYCDPEVFTLGLAGDYEPTVELRALGTYRRRQWKIEYTAAADFAFVGARETFEVLAN